jgi:hypothetical protein
VISISISSLDEKYCFLLKVAFLIIGCYSVPCQKVLKEDEKNGAKTYI